MSRAIWPVWDRYLRLPQEDRFEFDLTAEAAVVQRFMVGGVKREFNGLPGIIPLETNGFHLGLEGFSCGVDGLLICRFKKLDENGKSRNYPTPRAQTLRHTEETELAGLPDHATVVDVGYVLNDLRTCIRDVQVVRLLDTRYVMSIPKEEDGSIQITPSDFGNTPPSAPRFQIIRPKDRRTAGDSNDKE